MAASDLIASTVMDGAAALLNDPNKTVYTYAAQLPYLRIALQELREYYELHNLPVTEDVSTVIQVNAGVTEIPYNGAGTPTNPSLPSNMVEPKQLWERQRGIDPFVPMSKRDYLPHNMDSVATSQFVYYAWQGQKIKLLAANQNNDIKIDYILELFPNISTIDQNTQLNVVNAISLLEYRTAALCAEFIERNTTSSQSLNQYAGLALDRASGIATKGTQNIVTRRKPFRAAYKRSGWVT